MIFTERLGASAYGNVGIQNHVHGHMAHFVNMPLVKPGGRTTGQMSATINGVLVDVWMTCPLLKYPTAFETREYAVIPEYPCTSGPLTEGGDSGTIFVEATPSTPVLSRRVVGLLFGGGLRPRPRLNQPPLDMAGMEVTFLTPATRLLQWLKEDAGLILEFGDGPDC